MQWHDLTFDNPHQNVYWDELLLKSADAGTRGMTLRFWESKSPFVVLGRIGDATQELHLDRLASDGVPVVRRSSGGGTVVQGPGCLNYSLILSKQAYPAIHDLRGSYQWISEHVLKALKDAGVDGKFCPISDLATLDGLKFSGNAQKRGKTHILHHGTILYDFHLPLIFKYLRMPKDMPDYRQGRRHEDFVTNVSLDLKVFKQALSHQLNASLDAQPISQQDFSSLSVIPAQFFVSEI